MWFFVCFRKLVRERQDRPSRKKNRQIERRLDFFEEATRALCDMTEGLAFSNERGKITKRREEEEKREDKENSDRT